MNKTSKYFVIIDGNTYAYNIKKDGRLQVNINCGRIGYYSNGKPKYEQKSIYGHNEFELKVNIKDYLDGEEDKRLLYI